MKQLLGVLLTILILGSIISCSISEIDSTTNPTQENSPTTLSNNKRLSSLSVSNGKLDFNNDTKLYSITITDTVTTFYISPITEDINATVFINGTVVPSSFFYGIPLVQGDNTITLEVIAEDGNYTEFIIKVTTVSVIELVLGAEINSTLNPGDKLYYSFDAVSSSTYQIFAQGASNIAGHTTAIKITASNELSSGMNFLQDLTGTINENIPQHYTGKIYILLTLDNDTRSGDFKLKVSEI